MAALELCLGLGNHVAHAVGGDDFDFGGVAAVLLMANPMNEVAAAMTSVRMAIARYFFSIEMPPGPRLMFTPSGFFLS